MNLTLLEYSRILDIRDLPQSLFVANAFCDNLILNIDGYPLAWIGRDKLVYPSGNLRALVFLQEVTRLGESYMWLACGTRNAVYQTVLGFL